MGESQCLLEEKRIGKSQVTCFLDSKKTKLKKERNFHYPKNVVSLKPIQKLTIFSHMKMCMNSSCTLLLGVSQSNTQGICFSLFLFWG